MDSETDRPRLLGADLFVHIMWLDTMEAGLSMAMEDPSKHSERNRAYWATHRDEIAARKRAYRATHHDELSKYDRVYRAAHRVEDSQARRSYNQAYYAAHRKELSQRHRAYWTEHREEHIKNKQRRRALIAKVTATLTPQQWETIKAKYKHRCAYCGKKTKRLTQDHLVPLSKLGAHSLGNVVPACQSCNSRKGTRAPPKPVQPLLV